MRTTWLLGMTTMLLTTACAPSGAPSSEKGQGFATMASLRGGLASSSANPCPQVPDAPEVRAAVGSLPPPERAPAERWSQSYTGRYDRCGALTAVVVSLEGEKDPLGPRQVLFFHDGGFVGTADPCAFGPTEVKSARGDTVVVQYRWPRGQETVTTMTGLANIKYHWIGDKVVRVNQIPQALYDVSGCER
ncbi:LppP/LprE family lipoprotein [Segniliparus rugosus]|uniref:LppP/LprE lipoprotein n=1 Tax=Segniliparus rugosus (strain ATCC BAA-974 / DSM 45345 / CCUG 50838 / CIP 108380 / JCM 13579 / CDC 945) TaxID=679197 RepID=E5XS42_SEGRC|nr:LppP/LprE family lipoprotein [Segniliparus rugosus]EFV12827.1 hypothetical protein HMPREF9336_02314 [Segniliparus rugosus ATCC BAA-974]